MEETGIKQERNAGNRNKQECVLRAFITHSYNMQLQQRLQEYLLQTFNVHYACLPELLYVVNIYHIC